MKTSVAAAVIDGAIGILAQGGWTKHAEYREYDANSIPHHDYNQPVLLDGDPAATHTAHCLISAIDDAGMRDYPSGRLEAIEIIARIITANYINRVGEHATPVKAIAAFNDDDAAARADVLAAPAPARRHAERVHRQRAKTG